MESRWRKEDGQCNKRCVVAWAWKARSGCPHPSPLPRAGEGIVARRTMRGSSPLRLTVEEAEFSPLQHAVAGAEFSPLPHAVTGTLPRVRDFSPLPHAVTGLIFHLSRLRERSPARRVRDARSESRCSEPRMLQRALRGKGRVAYCSSPAASEPRPVVLPASRQVRPRQRDEVRRFRADRRQVRDRIPAIPRCRRQARPRRSAGVRARHQAAGRAVQADAVRARVRQQVDRAAAHRQARHVRHLPRPRSRACRHRQRDAGRRRVRADVPRIRRAVLPRREAARSAAVLGRRRARQRFLRARARLRLVRADRHAVPARAPARRWRSRSARNRASRSPSSATAARRRAISTARSTSPARAACRWSP